MADQAYNRVYYAAHREELRSYSRAYYAAHREEQRAWNRAYNASHREERQAYSRAYEASHREDRRARDRAYHKRDMVDLRALKLLRGCLDCGYDDNSDALQFDHRPGTVKARTVASLSGAALIAEIAKCDVVCANCHAIRTATRKRMN